MDWIHFQDLKLMYGVVVSLCKAFSYLTLEFKVCQQHRLTVDIEFPL